MTAHAFQKISVIGLGYIGLPTAAILASRKIEVLGVDVKQATVDIVQSGKTHFVEPELDMIVHAAVSEGFLRATTKPEAADAFIIAVPTPLKQDKAPDLSYVKTAVLSIASVLKVGDLIILESTSPVGTTEHMIRWLSSVRDDLMFPTLQGERGDVYVAYCPERVLPGHTLRELVYNDRVIGGVTPACAERASQLYQIFLEGRCLKTTPRTAEMCKLVENSFRDVNIAFANELSMVCDKLHVDVHELIQLANRHPRVRILQPGPGVGGHCIAVDPWFIVYSAQKEARLIREAREVNDSKSTWVVSKVKDAVSEYLTLSDNKTPRDMTIVCLGLSFKADIEDLRESPAVHIVHSLKQHYEGRLVVVEPHITHLPNELKNLVELRSLEEALLEADIVLKLVDHRAFSEVSKSARYQLIDVSARQVITFS